MRPSPCTSTTEAAISGDPDAILVLLKMSQPDIRRYARRTCRSTSDVEDAVQETLWILYRRIGRLQSAGAFSIWLFQIVHRTCLRLARQHFGLPDDISSLDNDLQLSKRPDSELRIDIAGAIQSLPAHYRQVLISRDVDEMTIGEIAQSLKLTRETVKARLHRARALVREYLMR
jgi:RNA polymerase sigma-70 factor (ECF subfamily)